MSKIEWTDETWNPVVGCSVVSPGCTNCYAMRQARRFDRPGSHYQGTTVRARQGKPVWSGKVALAPEHIVTAPLRWRKPRRVFVNSMGDLFHEDVPDEWIDKVFAVMALAPQHVFQVLTKRAERMLDYLLPRSTLLRIDRALLPLAGLHYPDPDALNIERPSWPLPNVWLGVSAEDQRRADERIPALLATPAAVRFVSAEPLLGPVDFRGVFPREASEHGIGAPEGGWPEDECDVYVDWVIVGGESGPGARPMHPDWARSIRDQCEAAGVAFFFKQWGAWIDWLQTGAVRWVNATPQRPSYRGPCVGMLMTGDDPLFAGRSFPTCWPDGTDFVLLRVGKERAGRRLDGREWNDMPAAIETPMARGAGAR